MCLTVRACVYVCVGMRVCGCVDWCVFGCVLPLCISVGVCAVCMFVFNVEVCMEVRARRRCVRVRLVICGRMGVGVSAYRLVRGMWASMGTCECVWEGV